MATLSAKQERAVALLASGNSARATARELGCGERTVRNWLALPAFKQALREAEAAVLAELARLVLSLPDLAVVAIKQVLEDESLSASVRLRGAQIAIDALLKVRELQLEQRVLALETQLLEGGRP
jgi:hypothetical protein